MVVAVVALLVAMSGTAVAASSLVNGDKLIKKNSLSGNRLRNHSVPGGKIQLSSLGTVPNAAHASAADNATNATNATKAGSAGSAPIAQVAYVSSSAPVNTSSGPATGVTLSATCPSGTVVTGGGGSVADTANGFLVDSAPTGKTGWTATFFDNAGTTTATVTAICAPAASTTP
jgi:hypothetical protein